MPPGLVSFLYTIILLGIVQGLIMAALLFFSKKQRYANKLLATLLLLICCASLNLYGSYKNWFGSAWLSFFASLLPLVSAMAFGPLIYFYVQASLSPSFKISRKQQLHFLPWIIDLVPTFTIIIFIAGMVLRIFKNNGQAWGNFIDAFQQYADIPRWASLTVYLWLSAKYLATAKKLGGIQPASYRWLQQLLRIFLVFQCIWLVYLVPYIIPKYSDKLLNAVDWYPLYIPMSIIVYWLGIKGYMVSLVPAESKKAAPQLPIAASVINNAVELIERAMQLDGLYLNPLLTVDVLAQHTSLPGKTISAVINQHIGKSFNEYVNGYRVEAFKQKIQNPAFDNLTIAGVALECGFNSQATFQRTFKQLTGMAPSEFRKSLPQAS